jgi:excisionase family DNA binding protein
MQIYNATIEVDRKLELVDVDHVMTALLEFSGSIGHSARGHASATISIAGETLTQATAAAVAVVEAALGGPTIYAEVMTEAEFNARQGWDPVPPLVSVTEAAEILGTSRSAVQQRIESGSLPAEKVGNTYALPRNAVIVAAGPSHPDYPFAVQAQGTE